jgi:DMSO reductase anchor subunit
MLLLSGIELTRLLAAVTAVSALALVIVMGRAYMLPVVPAWNTPLTILSFFASSILLGGGLVLLFYSPMDSFSRYVFTVVVLMELSLLVETIVSIWRYWLPVRGNRIETLRRYGDIHLPGVDPARIRAVHLGLILIFGVILYIGSAKFLLLWISFFLAFIGQAAGRVLFYEAGLGKRR